MFTATTVFNLDMFDNPEQEEPLNPEQIPETKKTDSPEEVMDSARSAETSLSLISSVTTGNAEQGLEENIKISSKKYVVAAKMQTLETIFWGNYKEQTLIFH